MSRRSQRISEINKTWHLRNNSDSSISEDGEETAFYTADSNSTVPSSPSASSTSLPLTSSASNLDELSQDKRQRKRRKTAQNGTRYPERSTSSSPFVGDIDVHESIKLSKSYSKKSPSTNDTNNNNMDNPQKQIIRLSNALPPLKAKVVEIGDESDEEQTHLLKSHFTRNPQEAITSMLISSSDDDTDIDIGDSEPKGSDLHSNVLNNLLQLSRHKKPKSLLETEQQTPNANNNIKEVGENTANQREIKQVKEIDINDLKREPQEKLCFIELELPTSYDNNIHGTLDFLQTEHIKEEHLAQKEKEEEQQKKVQKVAKFEKKLLSFHPNGWQTEKELMESFSKITEDKVLQVGKYYKLPLDKTQHKRSKIQEKFQILQKWIVQNRADWLSILKVLTLYALDYDFNKDVRDFRYTPLQITRFVLQQVPLLKSSSVDHAPVYQDYFHYISELNEYHQYVLLNKNFFLREKFFQYQYKNDFKQWLQHLKNVVLREEDEKDTKARGASLYEFLKFSTTFNLDQLERMHTFLLKTCGDSFSTNNVENALVIEYMNVYIQKHSVMEDHQGSIFDDHDDDDDDDDDDDEEDED